MLAGLVRNPNAYDPIQHAKAAWIGGTPFCPGWHSFGHLTPA